MLCIESILAVDKSGYNVNHDEEGSLQKLLLPLHWLGIIVQKVPL